MLHIFSASFVKKRVIIFLVFARIQVLIVFILLFPGLVHFDLRDAFPPVAYVPTVSSFLSIISDDSNGWEEEISTILRHVVRGIVRQGNRC